MTGSAPEANSRPQSQTDRTRELAAALARLLAAAHVASNVNNTLQAAK